MTDISKLNQRLHCEHVTDADTYQGMGFYECRKCHAVVGVGNPFGGYPDRVAGSLIGAYLPEMSTHNIGTAFLKEPATHKSDSEYIDEVFAELKATFLSKQKEYKGAHEDIFRNFNQGGLLQHETPEQTILGYVNKQIVSLFDAKSINPERLQDVTFVDEKAKDVAVYMIILMAMVRSKA
jgi:hypothetical protein